MHAAHSEQLSLGAGRATTRSARTSPASSSRIEHTRELRERQRADLAQAHTTLAELATHIGRDEQQLAAVRAELAQLAPQLEAAQQAESERRRRAWRRPSARCTTGSSAGRRTPQAVGAAEQSAQVERARIEQLENQAAAPGQLRRSAWPRNTSP